MVITATVRKLYQRFPTRYMTRKPTFNYTKYGPVPCPRAATPCGPGLTAPRAHARSIHQFQFAPRSAAKTDHIVVKMELKRVGTAALHCERGIRRRET